jgi:hypothetical protein
VKKRHVLAVLALSYLTLGIYVIYWLYRTRKDLLQFTADKQAIPKVITMFIPVFVLVGLVILLGVSAGIMSINGESSTAMAALSVVATIAIIGAVVAIFVVSFWWFYRYFQTIEQVVQGNEAMLFYTMWIALTLFGIGPVWVLIVQSDLNKFIDNGYHPLKIPMQPNYHPAAHQAHAMHPHPAPTTGQHPENHPSHHAAPHNTGQHPPHHQG